MQRARATVSVGVAFNLPRASARCVKCLAKTTRLVLSRATCTSKIVIACGLQGQICPDLIELAIALCTLQASWLMLVAISYSISSFCVACLCTIKLCVANTPIEVYYTEHGTGSLRGSL